MSFEGVNLGFAWVTLRLQDMVMPPTRNILETNAFKARTWMNRFAAALLTAVLWWWSFPPMDFSLLIMVALVPLLWLAEPSAQGNRMTFVFGAMLAAFGLGTWWVYHAALIGAVSGVVANAGYVTLALWIYRTLCRNTGYSMDKKPWLPWIFWISPWLAMEYVHQRIDLDFPWMLLGHAMANHPSWIQFYEWTGVAGGSLWILSVNFWAYRAWMHAPKFSVRSWAPAMLWLILPWGYSQWRYATYQPIGDAVKVAAIQPNMDPYAVKFDPSTYEEQMRIMRALSDSAADAAVVLWPETALPGFYQTGYAAPANPYADQLIAHHRLHPEQAWIVGASTVEWHQDKEHAGPYARCLDESGLRWYTAYNSALGFPSLRLEADSAKPMLYHKSKLVIGVEKLPYPWFFRAVSKVISVDLGGMSGQLGKQTAQIPMTMPLRYPSPRERKDERWQRIPLKAATLICYESIFGEFCGEFVRNGANLLCVITNDGWWGPTDGHRQHLAWARLRAIEFRRDVLRSANTGISATINQRGDLLDTLGWDQRGLVKGQLRLNSAMTFYARHGDFIGRIAGMITILTLLIAWVRQRIPAKPL
ncbi:MAG: apolipoprotein N-acyltransferase [Bacteroidota bacterium]